MAVSNRPWSEFTSASWPSAESYCSASLIDQNPSGSRKTKGLCKLPVREPGGDINRNALAAASAVLAGGRGGVDAPPDVKRAAARRLVALYATAQMEPPESLRRLAAG